MRNPTRTIAVAAVLALAGAALHAEDLTITSTATTNGKTSTTTSYFSATKFKTGNAEVETISDLSTGTLTFIEHKDKKYWQTTQADIEAAFKSLDAQMAPAGGMGGLMEKMMGGPMPDPTVAKGTMAKTIAGYPTEHWIVTAGDWKYEVWTAPSLQLPTSYWEAAKAPFAMMGPMAKRFGRFYDAMKQVKGFPLAHNFTYKIMGRAVSSSGEATAVTKGPIPAAAFEVPARYKKEDSPLQSMMKH